MILVFFFFLVWVWVCVIVLRRVCVPPADFSDESCLSPSRVLERLVEVKLLSTACRRERTDERPLHHPNGIHKALNQPGCLGFGWEKGKRGWELEEGKEERRNTGGHTHDQRTTPNAHTWVRGSENANTGVGGSGGVATLGGLGFARGFSRICPLGSGTELMPCCPQDGRTCDPRWPLAETPRQRIKGWKSLKTYYVNPFELLGPNHLNTHSCGSLFQT